MSEEDTMTPLREKEARHTLAASGLLVPLADQLAAAHRAGALEVIDALLVVKLEKSQRGRNITRADIIELRARYAEPEENAKVGDE